MAITAFSSCVRSNQMANAECRKAVGVQSAKLKLCEQKHNMPITGVTRNKSEAKAAYDKMRGWYDLLVGIDRLRNSPED